MKPLLQDRYIVLDSDLRPEPLKTAGSAGGLVPTWRVFCRVRTDRRYPSQQTYAECPASALAATKKRNFALGAVVDFTWARYPAQNRHGGHMTKDTPELQAFLHRIGTLAVLVWTWKPGVMKSNTRIRGALPMVVWLAFGLFMYTVMLKVVPL